MAPPAANSKPYARASLLLIGLAWTLPFLQPYHQYPIPTFYTEWLAFALGLAAALLLLRKESWFEGGLPVFALAPLALIGLLGLQILLGRVALPEQALTATLYLAWSALIITLGAVLVRELGMNAVATFLAWSLLAGGMLNAIAGILQHYWPASELGSLIALKRSVAVYGNIGQANHFANYITLALASAAYLYARGGLPLQLAGASAVLLLMVLSLSGSRSPWIYIGILAILALWWARSRTADGARLMRFNVCLLPGLVVTDAWVRLPFMLPKNGELLTSGERWFDAVGGLEARAQLAREAWNLFLDSPLLGAGWSQFTWHHFQHEAMTGERAAHGVFNHAHNLLFQLLAETGVAGAAIVVGVAAAWLWGRRGATHDVAHWWLLAVLSVIATHSLLEMPLWYSSFLGVASLLLGAGATQYLTLNSIPLARAAAAAIVAIGFLNLAWVLPAYREFERLITSMPRRIAIGPDAQALSNLVQQVHREPVLTYYLEVAISPGITISADQLHDKIALNARVMRFYPAELEVYRQALLLALAGERESALKHLEWAASVYPQRLPAVIETISSVAPEHREKMNPLLERALARSKTLRQRNASQ